jgi:hypothetical protein
LGESRASIVAFVTVFGGEIRRLMGGPRNATTARRGVPAWGGSDHGGAWVAAFYFEIVIGIPTFSIRPMVVWNKTLRIRKVVRSHTVSFTE